MQQHQADTMQADNLRQSLVWALDYVAYMHCLDTISLQSQALGRVWDEMQLLDANQLVAGNRSSSVWTELTVEKPCGAAHKDTHVH